MKGILSIYGIHTEIVNTILMLYKNTRYMVRSADGLPFFDITTGVLHEDKLAPCICIIYLHYILKKLVDINLHPGFTLAKEKSIDTMKYILPILTMLAIYL